jgi:hypothetical protein
MALAQAGCCLFQDLKDIGIVLPEYAQEITIVLPGYRQAVKIIVEGSAWDTCLKKESYYLTDTYGDRMMSEQFVELAKDVMKLPDEITKLEIRFAPDSIVTTTIECATPSGSLNFLEGYKLTQKKFKSEEDKAKLQEKIRDVLSSLKTKKGVVACATAP